MSKRKKGKKPAPRSPLARSVPPPPPRADESAADLQLIAEGIDATPANVEEEPIPPTELPVTRRVEPAPVLEVAVEPPRDDRRTDEVGRGYGHDEEDDEHHAHDDARNMADRIRELEARLDSMIEASQGERGRESRPPPSFTSSPPPSAPQVDEGNVFDTARELLSTDFYLRKWGRLGMRNRSEEVDDFGFDPVYEQKVLPLFNFLYEKYFRVEVEGVGNVPADGRCLLVCNHSGTIPFDGMMLKLAVKREHAQQRDVRWLAEDFIFHFPFLGSFSNRVGAVRACQENAERLLAHEALVAVFPEGVKGIGKLFKDRYRLQRFGRGGFVKLCLRTDTPIVPVAIVGGEETNPMLFRFEYLTKALGLPYVPVTPTFPALGPLGLVPAPTKWKIFFGEPVTMSGYGPESADDEILVGRLSERVRATIQGMLDRALAERRSIFFG